MRRRNLTPAHSLVNCISLNFEAANVIDHRLTPAIDVRPRAIANAVLRARYVDHVTAAVRRRYTVVRLLIGDNDDAVILIAQAAQSMAQLRSTVGLAGYNRITQSKATTRRYPQQFVGEAVDLDCVADFAQQHSQSACRIHTQHLRTAGEWSIHAAGSIDQ